MITEIYTAPATEPITLEELKTHLRIDTGTVDDDTLVSLELASILTAATEYVETITRRKLISQTWDYYLDEFPCEDFIKLPYGRLTAVSSVSYKDTAGTETTMTVTTDYIVEANKDHIGRLVLPYGESWPSDTLYPSKPIKIRFVCGWATAAALPEKIVHAVKLAAKWIYEEGAINGDVDRALNALLADYRLHEQF